MARFPRAFCFCRGLNPCTPESATEGSEGGRNPAPATLFRRHAPVFGLKLAEGCICLCKPPGSQIGKAPLNGGIQFAQPYRIGNWNILRDHRAPSFRLMKPFKIINSAETKRKDYLNQPRNRLRASSTRPVVAPPRRGGGQAFTERHVSYGKETRGFRQNIR